MSSQPDTLLFVCTANICRSPMAARLMRHALEAEPEPLRSLKVESAGVVAGIGDAPSRNSEEALRKVNLDLKNHRSQPVTPEMLDRALAVFCMTESHRAMLNTHFHNLPEHVYLMRELFANGGNPEIPDPYGMSLGAYEACRDSMVEAVPSLLQFLRKLKS